MTDPVTPPNPPRRFRGALKHLRASDVLAVSQLATQATVGVTDIAEGVHQSVWGTLGVSGPAGSPSGLAKTGGIAGLVYNTIRGVTQLVGKGLAVSFTQLQPLLEAADRQPEETPEREAVLAALNGVMGDRLADTNNPLATPMRLRQYGRTVTGPPDAAANHAAKGVAQRQPGIEPTNTPPATGKVLLLIHGLCMNDLQWATPQHNHGDALAQALGYTPVYLRYNTGLHVSDNGVELAGQLETLLTGWPVLVTELCVVAHSMGGLVIRSATHHAQTHQLVWRSLLKRIVFLGTPHHGTPLERAGNWLDVILGSTPYSKPFAKLGQLRSAGITDLRYGHVVQADWQGHDRFHKRPDTRVPVPLPAGVECYTVAATLAEPWAPKTGAITDNLVGDGLVPLPSALGHHALVKRRLNFNESNRRVMYATHHMALLSSAEVGQQLISWLKEPLDP